MDDPRAVEAAANAAVQSGNVGEGVTGLLRAAELYIAAQQPAEARRLYSSVAFMMRQLGVLEGAVEVVNGALALPGAPEEDDWAMASFAGVLDRAIDPRASALWRRAADTFARTNPLMHLNCLAHAAGADLAHDEPNALGLAHATMRRLTPDTPPSFVAGIIGAIGDSAGERGVPFLAQAVWLMVYQPDAYNTSTQPFWIQLIERSGFASELALALCALGLGCTVSQPALEQQLMPVVLGVTAECAKARGVAMEAMVEDVKRSVSLVGSLGATLERLVPRDHWLLVEPAPPN